MSPFGQAGARSGAGCGATGRGKEAGRAVGRPGCRGGGRVSQRAVRATAERATRRAAASHEQRRRELPQRAGGRPKAAAPCPPPTLTMSICCCFFFRDYGSSKRKSGKRISAHIFLTFQLHALVPLILRRTFAGGGGWGGGGMPFWPAALSSCLPRGEGAHLFPPPCPLPSKFSAPHTFILLFSPSDSWMEVGVHGVGGVSGTALAPATSAAGSCISAAGATAGYRCGFLIRRSHCVGRVCGYAGSSAWESERELKRGCS